MGAEEEGDTHLNLLNGVEHLVNDLVQGKFSQDTIEKTVIEVQKILPNLGLNHFKVVSEM